MTMLASWVGIDTHGIASAYLLADSRFSWKAEKGLEFFDYGKKVFASSVYPEIMGYSGDVLFPTVVISQILAMVDLGIIFKSTTSCNEKKDIVFQILKKEIQSYPKDYLCDIIQVLYITRDTIVSGYPAFHAYLYTFDKNCEWRVKEVSLPKKSGTICILGSGRKEFEDNYGRYKNGNNSDTSRSVYHCFIDTLSSIEDEYCGGAPQMVGIYRKPKSSGRCFGVVYNNKKHILGLELNGENSYNNIEWRNELFELIDGNNNILLPGAQRQPNVDKC